jgi:hypothetical protein
MNLIQDRKPTYDYNLCTFFSKGEKYVFTHILFCHVLEVEAHYELGFEEALAFGICC